MLLPLRIVDFVVTETFRFKISSKFSVSQFGVHSQIIGEFTNPDRTRGHLHLEYVTVKVESSDFSLILILFELEPNLISHALNPLLFHLARLAEFL